MTCVCFGADIYRNAAYTFAYSVGIGSESELALCDEETWNEWLPRLDAMMCYAQSSYLWVKFGISRHPERIHVATYSTNNIHTG